MRKSNFTTTPNISPLTFLAWISESTLNKIVTWHFIAFFISLILQYRLTNKIILGLSIVALISANMSKIADFFKCLFASVGLFWGIFLLEIWGALSLFWSYVPSISRSPIFNQAAVFLFCLLSAYFLKEKNNLAENLKLSAKIIIIVSLLYTLLYYDESMTYLGLKSLFRHKNHLGFAMAISIISILLTPKLRPLDALIALLGFILLIMSQSKTSLSLTIYILALLLLTKTCAHIYKNSSVYFQGFIQLAGKFCMVLFYLLILLMVIFRESIVDNILNTIPFDMFTGRGEIWFVVLSRIGDHLLAGIGPGVFYAAGDQSEVLKVNFWIHTMRSSDGGYVDLIVSLGFIGLAFLCTSIIQSYRALSFIYEDKNFAVCFALITFFMFHNITETDVYNSGNTPWFLFNYVSAYLIFRVANTKNHINLREPHPKNTPIQMQATHHLEKKE